MSTRITLIRHGRPQVRRTGVLSADEFEAMLLRYDTSGVDPNSRPNRQLSERIRKADELVCSDLPRAVESAFLLRPDSPPRIDRLYREVSFPRSWRRCPALPARMWMGLLRGAWFAGYRDGAESLEQARIRAGQAASQLVALAEGDRQVAVVGHGLLNILIGHALRQEGWVGPWLPSRAHWDHGDFVDNETLLTTLPSEARP